MKQTTSNKSFLEVKQTMLNVTEKFAQESLRLLKKSVTEKDSESLNEARLLLETAIKAFESCYNE